VLGPEVLRRKSGRAHEKDSFRQTKLVQIGTAYGQPKDGSAALPRNK
jgi:hypothetical protein